MADLTKTRAQCWNLYDFVQLAWPLPRAPDAAGHFPSEASKGGRAVVLLLQSQAHRHCGLKLAKLRTYQHN